MNAQNHSVRCWVAVGVALLAGNVAAAAPFVLARDPQCVAFSPDGTKVVFGYSGESSGESVAKPHPDPRRCGVIQVIDVVSNKRLWRMETFGDLVRVEFSPDGRAIAMARLFSPGDGLQLNEVRLFNPADGATLHVFDRCHGFAWSADGKSLAILSRTKCAVYDHPKFEKQREIDSLGGAFAVSWRGNGRLIAGLMNREGKIFARLCDAARGKPLAETVLLTDPFYTATFTKDGRQMVTGHPGGIGLFWDISEADALAESSVDIDEPLRLRPIGKLETGDQELVHPILSPDGKMIALVGQEQGTVVTWSSDGSKELGKFALEKGPFRTIYRRPAEIVARPERDPNRFCFLPDSSGILCGCQGGVARGIDGREIRRYGDY